LEGHNFNKTKVLTPLSEQHFVDCSKSNFGCDGGVITYAFQFAKQNGGIASAASYPYTGKEEKCRYNPKTKAASCSGWVDLPVGSEAALQRAVATAGPVAVGIDASLPQLQLYRKGVFRSRQCSSTEINHAVLLVGYGMEKDEPYWLIKNSWGTGWGDDGYLKLARNAGNMCGIATSASYPRA